MQVAYIIIVVLLYAFFILWIRSPFIFAGLAFKHRNYVENKKQNHE